MVSNTYVMCVSRGGLLLRAEQLVAGLAHEIRNPLTTINGFLQLLAERVADDARAAYYLETIFFELRRLEGLVEECIALGRLEALPFSFCDLKTMMKEVAVRAVRLTKDRSIKVEVRADSCPPVEAVPRLLQQLLWNLVTNALSAIPSEGQITLELTRLNDNWLQLVCRDTGTGISPSVLPQIFRPYFTTKEGGIGLGLSFCRKIAEFHGGRLEVESKLGLGTSFTLQLPLRQELTEK